jgi:hypothetical protein
VSADDEQTGLDLSEHGEIAYQTATAPDLTTSPRGGGPGSLGA